MATVTRTAYPMNIAIPEKTFTTCNIPSEAL